MRIIKLNKGKLVLKDGEVEGFLERIVTPIGTSAKADVPKKYLGKRVYVIVTKKRLNHETRFFFVPLRGKEKN